MEKKKNQIDADDYILDKIYDKDLGDMYMIYDKAIIARCSDLILFFKLEYDPVTKEKSWTNYHTEEIRGFVYFIKGNKRIQITTENKIYFFLVDPETLMPELENVMYNYMNCTQMMFGSKVKYCITYKTNQKSFDIYTRKYEHDFRVNVVNRNMNGSIGLPILQLNAFLVSNLNEINVFDVDTFQEIKSSKIVINLLKTAGEREPNEVIAMQVCQKGEILAVISGKKLIMNMQKPNQLFLFRRMQSSKVGEMDKFELFKRIVIKDIEIMNDICMQFHFKATKPALEATNIIFAN